MNDTLQIDSTLVNALSADNRYDYDRELVGGSQNLMEWVSSLLREWLLDNLGVAEDSKVTYYVFIVLGFLLIALLGWLVYRRRHALLLGTKEHRSLDYSLEEDTIYGIDFDDVIRQMVEQANWRQAVRLVYLQTLKQLSDTSRLDWQPSKTPAQYAAEVSDAAFTALSGHFVRVRYGNFDADEALYHEMKRLQSGIVNSSEQHAETTAPSGRQAQKGGEPTA